MANIYPPTDNLPVAYASNNVNSTADVARGSLNQSESKALDNGYGREREQRLTAAGHDYRAVQRNVNKLMK